MKLRTLTERLTSTPWLAETIALLSGTWYMAQAFQYAHLQESILDEGAYLNKGLLFVSGQYSLFQPYGPWTNHMPLSFLIPGYVQALINPGIRSGRYFTVLLSGLMLLGIWILAHRLGNKWCGAAAVWIIAWNPTNARMYSVAVSQGIVACMLVWTLILTMGEKRPLWEITLGSILSGLIVMTRINMLPVLPLLVLYVFWQHGKRAGIVSALIGGLTVILGHAIYWPGILQMWTHLPRSLAPFLNDFRPPGGGSIWEPEVSLNAKILTVLHSIRLHYAAVVGTLASWLFWVRKDKWKSQSDFRSGIFLSLLFLALLYVHMWATLEKDYCVFCLGGYLAFFSVIGVLINVTTFPEWRKRSPLWFQIVIVLTILILSAGLGYGAFENIGHQLMEINIPRKLLGSSAPGYAPLSAILTNKFGLESQLLRRLLPTVSGLAAGVSVLILAFVISVILKRQHRNGPEGVIPDFGYLALTIFLLVGIVLSPTVVLGGEVRPEECRSDIIASYEAAGKHLAQNIPPGSLVYWQGGLSAVPLLYLPGTQIFPPQINDGYSFFRSGDTEAILKYGGWNNELAVQWVGEADTVLIEGRYLKGWLRDAVMSGSHQELPPTHPIEVCRDGSEIHIFQRSP